MCMTMKCTLSGLLCKSAYLHMQPSQTHALINDGNFSLLQYDYATQAIFQQQLQCSRTKSV